LPIVQTEVLLASTASFEGSHGDPFVFPVWRIFWTTVGGSASVGAASAALDAWAVCIKKLVEVQSKY
jgi:hypothetical protein